MKETSVYDCAMVSFDTHSDRKGNISVVHNGAEVSFDIKRCYYLYDIPAGESRGGHAHRALSQLIVAASGSFAVVMDDGGVKRRFVLDRPFRGLFVPPGLWRELEDFSSGAVCLVLASHHYDEADYIRDYAEFKEYKKGLQEHFTTK